MIRADQRPPTDQELLGAVRDEIARSGIVTPNDNVRVHVVEGNAVLTGTVAVWDEVDQLKALVARVPGVHGVVASIDLDRRSAGDASSSSR